MCLCKGLILLCLFPRLQHCGSESPKRFHFGASKYVQIGLSAPPRLSLTTNTLPLQQQLNDAFRTLLQAEPNLASI